MRIRQVIAGPLDVAAVIDSLAREGSSSPGPPDDASTALESRSSPPPSRRGSEPGGGAPSAPSAPPAGEKTRAVVGLACRIDDKARRVKVELGAGRGASAVWLPPGLPPDRVAAAIELRPAAGHSFQVEGLAQPEGGSGPREDVGGELRLFVFAGGGRLLRFFAASQSI